MATSRDAWTAPAPPAPEQGRKKRQPTVGPVRYNLEAFGVAILGAVLLKWFCLEAFAIPTASMQPTLMGSSEAGIYDRLLVDKLSPLVREPQRWDVTVFSYPLQKNQNYVKRLVGMPGEHLYIGGGNLHTVEDGEGGRTFTVLRKPDDIQDGLWKEVYPTRQLVRGEPNALTFFYASPSPRWRAGDEPGSFAVELEGGRTGYRLAFKDEIDGGFTNRVWDGYPVDIARAIRSSDGARSLPLEMVPDARIEATVTPEQTIDELVLEVVVRRPGQPTLTFALVVEGGRGRLLVRRNDEIVAQGSDTFVCEFEPGVATRVGFAHVDDQLIAYRDGAEDKRFDVSGFAIREGCELPSGPTEDHGVVPQLRLSGQGKVHIEGLRIWRDLHYTSQQFPDARGVIEIPKGHYFMMGDNTLQSIDSRGWTALTVGVLPDGTVIPPDQVDQHPGARELRGNQRIFPPDQPPDRDETPVLVDGDRMVMIDEFGEIHALHAQAQVAGGGPGKGPYLSIQAPGGQNGRTDWKPPTQWVPFVPREHIRGRALLIFWRWPLPRLMPIR